MEVKWSAVRPGCFTPGCSKGAQLVSEHKKLKIHQHFETVKVYTLLEQYGTHQTRVTGLQDSGCYSIEIQRKQKCVTMQTSNDYFLGEYIFCTFLLLLGMLLDLHCR
jgi:hypothetical protein